MTGRRDLFLSVAVSASLHALALAFLRVSSGHRGEGGAALEIRVVGIVQLAAAAEIPPAERPDPEEQLSPLPPSSAGAETAEAEEAPSAQSLARASGELELEEETPERERTESPREPGGPDAPEPEAPPAPAGETATPGELGAPGDLEASRGSVQDARSRYIAEVLARIHRAKRYPEQARWKGQEGLVEVRFAIEGGGKVSSVEIVKSSGHSLLDAEARAMVLRAAPFGEIPKEVGMRLRLIAPIRFELSPGR